MLAINQRTRVFVYIGNCRRMDESYRLLLTKNQCASALYLYNNAVYPTDMMPSKLNGGRGDTDLDERPVSYDLSAVILG